MTLGAFLIAIGLILLALDIVFVLHDRDKW